MDTVPQIVPISDLRNRHNDVINKLSDGPVILAQRSKAAAVLVSVEEWDQVIKDAKQYRHLAMLERRSQEMDEGHFVTQEAFGAGLGTAIQ